jgi:hypothetical protein
VIVAAFIASLNVAVGEAVVLTPVAPPGGATLVTAGGVVSASAVTVTVVFAVAEPEAFVAVNV